MSKITLTLDEEIDFKLIGISCHARDYRLCHELNKNLGIDLQRDEDLEVKYEGDFCSYSLFCHGDEEDHNDLYIISNRGTDHFLVPEQKQADYFALIKGAFTDQDRQELIRDISKLKIVLAAYAIDPEKLKSKNNLLF